MEKWSVFSYSLVSWIVITLFAILPKKLPITENLCVYFCTSLLMTSTFTTLNINLKRLVNSQRLDFYFCHEFAIYIIFPGMLLIFTNIFFTAKSSALRLGSALFTFAVLCSVFFSLIGMKIITPFHWSPWQSLLMFALFMFAAWLLEKTLAHFRNNETVKL